MRITLNRVAAGKQVFLLAGAALLLAACSPSGPEALHEGERLLNADKPAAALTQLQRAVSVLDKTPQAWNLLGLAYHKLGKAEDASKAYRQALALDPNLVVVRFNLGCLLLEHRNPAAAATELATYTVHNPNSIEGWLKLSAAQLRSRQLEAADLSLRRALALNPRSAEAFNSFGVLQVQRNRPRDAFQSFSSATQLQPGYAPALLNLAVVTHTGFAHKPVDYRPAALQKYKEFLALQPRPTQWDAVSGIVQQLELDLAPPKPAPLPPTNLVAVTPKPPVTNTFVRPPVVPPRTETTTMVARVTSPSVITPAPPTQTTVVAVVRQLDPVPAKPSTDFLPTVPPPVVRIEPPVRSVPPAGPPMPRPTFTPELEPRVITPLPVATIENPLSPLIKRYSYRNPGRPAPGNRVRAEGFHATGLEYQERGRWREALEYYEKAVQVDPTLFEAHHNLGLMAAKVDEAPRALAAFETALALQPAALSARFNFALTLQKLGYYRDGANELERLLGDYPDEPRAHLALANLYAQQLFEASQARIHYLKVLQLEPQHPQGTALRYWLRDHP